MFSAFKEAGVNLLAFSGFPIGAGMAQLDFVPEDPDAFTKAAGDLDLDFSERKNVFLIQGDDRIGAAAETCRTVHASLPPHSTSRRRFAGRGHGERCWIWLLLSA